MKQNSTTPSNEYWDRLLHIMESTGHTPYSFARHLGMSRPEILYQVKKGNNKISIPLAQCIHKHYPQFSLGWILCGEIIVAPPSPPTLPSPPLPTPTTTPTLEQQGLVSIPIYSGLPSAEVLVKGPIDRLTITAAVSCGAELAALSTEGMCNPCLPRSILLMKRHKGELYYGKMYYIETREMHTLRILTRVEGRPEMIGLTTIFGSSEPRLIFPKTELWDIWLVVGAVSKLK